MKFPKISKHPRNINDMKTTRNYNVKPPKLGGGQGIKSPAVIAKALGVTIGMPVHQRAVAGLMSHPNTDVVSAAKKLMKKF